MQPYWSDSIPTHQGPLSLTVIRVKISLFSWGIYVNGGLADIRAWMSNYILQFYVDAMNFPSFNLSAISLAPGIGKPAYCEPPLLTHWGRVTHICFSKLTIIGSDNGLLPGRRQAIIWTNAGLLLIWTVATNFSEIFSEIHTFSFRKMCFKKSSGKWGPFCLGLNVLTPLTWMNRKSYSLSADANWCQNYLYKIL